MGENKARASDSVIHPRSPTYKTLSDADNANSSTALSLRASGGADVPPPKAALIVSHIPMIGRLSQHCVLFLDPRSVAGLAALPLLSLKSHVRTLAQTGKLRHCASPPLVAQAFSDCSKTPLFRHG